MRSRFAELIAMLPTKSRVLELGSGPGLLAECILDRCANLERYTLLDFSDHMLIQSRDRLRRFPIAEFVNANFKARDWTEALDPPYTAVIAMQSVHEIRHKRHIPGLYRQLRQVLAPGGMVAVCDGTPEDTDVLWRRSLFLTLDEQIEALASTGFADVALDRAVGNIVLVAGRISS